MLPHDILLYKDKVIKTVNVFDSDIVEDECAAIILNLLDFLFKYYSHLKVTKGDKNHEKVITGILFLLTSIFVIMFNT